MSVLAFVVLTYCQGVTVASAVLPVIFQLFQPFTVAFIINIHLI